MLLLLLLLLLFFVVFCCVYAGEWNLQIVDQGVSFLCVEGCCCCVCVQGSGTFRSWTSGWRTTGPTSARLVPPPPCLASAPALPPSLSSVSMTGLYLCTRLHHTSAAVCSPLVHRLTACLSVPVCLSLCLRGFPLFLQLPSSLSTAPFLSFCNSPSLSTAPPPPHPQPAFYSSILLFVQLLLFLRLPSSLSTTPSLSTAPFLSF